MDSSPAWSGMPGVFSWLTPLLFLLGCWGCLFIPMTAMWSYQRHVCLSTMYKKMCKNISMSTVNQWPLSAAWLWRLRHPSLCSPANGGLLDPRHKGPVWGTRDGCALSFWQGSQFAWWMVPWLFHVCVQRAGFSVPLKETWRGPCKEYVPEFYLCSS